VGRGDLLLEKGGTVLSGDDGVSPEPSTSWREGPFVRGREKIIEIVLPDGGADYGARVRYAGKPYPGNIRGGLTTIEEKSLGAICKSGSRPIHGVLEYGQSVSQPGLFVLDSPGQEAVLLTGLAAGGANVIVFSTGGGAPQGYPLVPVIKVAGNPQKCRDMKDHIDLDVSGILQGADYPQAGKEIYVPLERVAGDKKVKAETLKYDQTVEIYTTGPTYSRPSPPLPPGED
jgi:altronate dehydratase large subunit